MSEELFPGVSSPDEQPITRRQLLRSITAGGALLIGGAALAACEPSGAKPAAVNVTFLTNAWPGDAMPTKDEQSSSPQKKAYADTLQKWLGKNPGVTIKHTETSVWDPKALTTAISAGTSPTWFMGNVLGYFQNPQVRSAFVRGLVADLTSLVSKYKIDDQVSDFVVPMWKDWKVNGKYYGIPAGSGVGNGIYYRRDLIKQAGLQEPTADWNLNDFRALAKALTKDKTKGVALQFYGFGQFLNAHGLLSATTSYGTIGMLPSPQTGWRWRYDFTTRQDRFKDAVNLWRAMRYEDKSLLTDLNYGDSDVSKAFIRGDVAMMGNNTDYFTRSPEDPASVMQLANSLKKPLEEVVGWLPHPKGTTGAFGNTQAGLAVGSIEPHLQRNAAGLEKAFDFMHYMLMGDGLIDQITATYQSTKDLKRVFTSVPPMTKNQEKIAGIPGTAEDAWGKQIVDAVKKAAVLPLIPDPALYLPAEQNTGVPGDAFDDMVSGLAHTQKDMPPIFANAQNTLNQQAAGLTSSISSDEFIKTAKEYYKALDAFWSKNAPVFYATDFKPWYTEKVLPVLGG
jgi:hypothetical protein